MLSALNDAGAEYLIVGAYALGAYGNPRPTGDIDFWVRPSPENAERVYRALRSFGIPGSWVASNVELTDSDAVFMFGVAPQRIDILTSITGIDFDSAWANRQPVDIDGLPSQVIHWRDLLTNKRAAGRPKDAVDADWIEVVMRKRGETI